MSSGDISHVDNRPGQPGRSVDFSAPLGNKQSGRLVFASDARRVRLKAGRVTQDLYRASFREDVPSVQLRDDVLIIQYQHDVLRDPPAHRSGPWGEIVMNGTIPWEIEFRGGVFELKADLGELQLRSLDILGGARQIELALAETAGTTFIYIAEGILQSAISRPVGVGLRGKISGGVNDLTFDGQFLSAVGGEISLESPDFKRAASRYDICIVGGASQVTIGHGEAVGLRR